MTNLPEELQMDPLNIELNNHNTLKHTIEKPRPKKQLRCIARLCKNTSTLNPDKIFLTVPVEPKMRQKWSIALRTTFNATSLYCCEDHFDMQEDAENWIRYKLTGNVKLRLKKDAVPHIFKDSKKNNLKRLAASKLAQKRLVKEAIAAAEEKERQIEARKLQAERLQHLAKEEAAHKAVNYAFKLITTGVNKVIPPEPRRAPIFEKSVQVTRTHNIRSKAIQCCLEMCDFGDDSLKRKRTIRKKKGRWGRKRKKAVKPVMKVFESSDDEDSEYDKNRRCSMRCARKKHKNIDCDMQSEDIVSNGVTFTSPMELVEATLSDEENRSDKAIQAYIRPPHRNKGVTCILPMLPIQKLPPKACTSSLVKPHQDTPTTPVLNPVLNRHNSDLLPPSTVNANQLQNTTPTKHYIIIGGNAYNYEINKSYLLINSVPPCLVSIENPINECEKSDVKTDEIKLKLEPESIKDDIKEEIIDEDYQLPHIKQEIEESEDTFESFTNCCVKQEPIFDEYTHSY